MVKKTIGIEAQKPKEKCSDRNCPWHSTLSLRGRVLQGTVIRDKAPLTVIVEWGFTRYVTKYERYERRHSSVAAHNPPCINAKAGDVVKIAECRPLSKTKSFAVIEKVSI